MFLFLSDHARFPTAIADTQTSNKSFLHLAGLYKSMGVKNYYFHLTLLQPDLVGVDPFSPTLTMDQKTMIKVECEYNPWYFFREIYRITDGARPLRFRANRPLVAMLWCFFCGIDFALIIPRQNGKSITADGLEIWLMLFYYKNTEMILFTKNDDLRKTNIARIKKAQRLLPTWLNPLTPKDADNTEVLTCLARGNTYRTAVGQAAEFNADNVGRGPTYPYTHTDEGPFIINVHRSLPVLSGSTTAARENAEENGTLYGNLYTTTAGKLDSKEGAYMHSFIYSGTLWNEIILDAADKLEAREIVKKGSSEGRCLVHGTFSHRQCGRTDDWLRSVLLLTKRTDDEIARDFLNKWTSGTEYSALSTKLLEIIRCSEMPPFYTHVSTDRYLFNWYIPEQEIEHRMSNGQFVLGLDSSEAMGRDANALVLTDTSDLAVVGVQRVNEASLHKYAVSLAKFMIRYPNVTLIIEKKSSAPGIIDTIIAVFLANGIDPFKRIYNRIVDEHLLHKEEYLEISKPLAARNDQLYVKYKAMFGFITSKATRQFLYDTVLEDAVKSTGHVVHDENLSSELRGLIIKNGRVDHLPGGHDDTVIAWLLCHWFIKHSKNLRHYGINPLQCLIHVSSDGATLTKEDVVMRNRMTELKNEINLLKEDLIASSNSIDIVRLERLLAYQVKQLNNLGDITVNMDQLMREVKENKNQRLAIRNTVQSAAAIRIGMTPFNQRY